MSNEQLRPKYVDGGVKTVVFKTFTLIEVFLKIYLQNRKLCEIT